MIYGPPLPSTCIFRASKARLLEPVRQVRRPKAETRKKSETRSPKLPTPSRFQDHTDYACPGLPAVALEPDVFQTLATALSDFGLRPSAFGFLLPYASALRTPRNLSRQHPHEHHPQIPPRPVRPHAPAHRGAVGERRIVGQRVAGYHADGPVAHLDPPWPVAGFRLGAIPARGKAHLLQAQPPSQRR